MKKIYHFDSPPEAYTADAAVLCCFDQRIRLAVNKFLQRRGILRPDMIVVAGGAIPKISGQRAPAVSTTVRPSYRWETLPCQE